MSDEAADVRKAAVADLLNQVLLRWQLLEMAEGIRDVYVGEVEPLDSELQAIHRRLDRIENHLGNLEQMLAELMQIPNKKRWTVSLSMGGWTVAREPRGRP